jgi:hypothetical protein
MANKSWSTAATDASRWRSPAAQVTPTAAIETDRPSERAFGSVE